MSGSYTSWSLLGGWLPGVVAIVAWTTFLVGVAWRRRPAWHWVVIAAVAGVSAVVLARFLINAPARFGSTYPRSFLAWGAFPIFAAGAAMWEWNLVGWTRRALVLVSVPALAVFGAMQINIHYGHVPTVGDLLHTPLVGQVDAARLLDPIDDGLLLAAARTAGKGLVAQVDLPAPVSKFQHRRGWVWVPPAYFAKPRPRLPVIMLMSGTPGSPDDWLRAGGALRVANEWAEDHGGVAPVMVLPDINGSELSDTECVDGPRGQAETYLTVDVPRFMIEHFGVAQDPREWAVAGMSEGGTCALTLATRHPNLFSTFVDFSGDPAPNLGSDNRTIDHLYGGSEPTWRAHDPTNWFAEDSLFGVEGYFAVGSSDEDDIANTKALSDRADAARLATVTKVYPGHGHNWYMWKRALNDAFPWVVGRLDR